jgi:hypothetical protein
MLDNIKSYWFVALWLFGLVVLFVPPRDPPGAAPVRAAEVAPYAQCAPALSYEERFSPACIGPPISSYFKEPCEVSRAAVTAQGVGE